MARNRESKTFRIHVSVRVRPVLSSHEAERVQYSDDEAKHMAVGVLRPRSAASAEDAHVKGPSSFLVKRHEWNRGRISVGGSSAGVKTFTCFSNVMVPSETQASAQDRCMPGFVDSLMQGYNCTLFAYGQTGSGKTYTMFGPEGGVTTTSTHGLPAGSIPQAWGMFPRTAAQVLYRLGLWTDAPGVPMPMASPPGGGGGAGYDDGASGTTSLAVSAVEVYFDEVFDLLNERKNVRVGGAGAAATPNLRKLLQANTRSATGKWVAPYLASKQARKAGRHFGLKGQREVPLRTVADIVRITKLIEATRVAKGHKLNHRSSRSHCVVTLSVRQQRGRRVVASKFLFVDLAGSERIFKSGVTGERRKEAVAVNSSLTTLGRCIKCLGERRRGAVVPYRDSTLTMLMKNSLGGNARTAMVVTVTQDPRHGDESKSSLRFGERCADVRTRVTQTSVDVDAEVRALRGALDAAQAKVTLLASQGQAGGINTAEAKCIQESFWVEKAKLDRSKAVQAACKDEMTELRAAGKQGCKRFAVLTTRLANAAHEQWVQDGVVTRMIYSGLWRPPSRAYAAAQADVSQLQQRIKRATAMAGV